MKMPCPARILVSLSFAASIVGVSGVASAWTGLDEPPLPHWGTVPVPYYLNKATFPPDIAAMAEQRVLAGFASWSAPTCTYFDTALMGDAPGGTYDVKDGKNVLLWINKPNTWPSELGPEDSVIGVTLPIWSNDGNGHSFIDDADIIFNNVGFCWFDYDPANPLVTCSGGKPADTLSILTHEQGHFLGLGHTNVLGATMEAAYLGGNDLATLEQDDRDGVCALYPLGGMGAGTSCDACRDNAEQSGCDAAAKACTSKCLGLADCVMRCPKNDAAYDACATQCTKQFPDGLMAYTAYTNCFCNICAEPCAPKCAGPGQMWTCGSINSGNGAGTTCPTPSFVGEGGCGCSLVGTNAPIQMLASVGLILAGALGLRRRR